MTTSATRDVVVLRLSFPTYRQHFIEALTELRPNIQFLDGAVQLVENVDSSVASKTVTRTGPVVYLLGRRLVWMSNVMVKCCTARVCVVELNPRIINSWLILLYRRARGRPSVAWGHAWPRAGRGARSDFVRGLMRQLADRLIVYTKTSAAELALTMGPNRVFAAPNSLYPAAMMQPQVGFKVHRLLWIGRMVEEKRPLLALEAFRRVVDDLPKDVVLTFVGDGPLRPAIQDAVETSGLYDRVELLGWENNPESLSALFAESVALVASGYVGLNVTQGLGFGIPIIYALGEQHAPEIEAVTETNSRRFVTGDPESLARVIVSVAEDRVRWISLRQQIAAETRASYSSERMAEGFNRALEF